MRNEQAGASLAALFAREWQIKQQGWTLWLNALVIFLVIVGLFPLAIGAQTALLLRLAAPIVWIAALLSLAIGVDGLFKPEFDNGTLAQLVASGSSLALWVLARLTLHWVFGAGFVALLSFLAAPLFGLGLAECATLCASIFVASPILLALLAIASALTLAAKNAAVLVPLIALPLQLPVLIFATGAVDRFAMGLPYLPIFALLLGGSILALIATPWTVAFALKLAWQSG